MTKTLHSKDYFLMKCNSCSVVQSFNYIPNFCNICNSVDIELYFKGRNTKEIKGLRYKYFKLDKYINRGDGNNKISLEK